MVRSGRAGQAGAAELRGHLEAHHGVLGVRADDHGRRAPGLRGDGGRLLGQRQRDAVEADAEPDARRGLAPQQLHEPVIAAAAAEGLLLPFCTRSVELEGRARVVVEAADKGGRQPGLDGERLEVGEEPIEVGSAVVAEVLASMVGAAAISAAMRSSLESRRRSGLVASRVRSSSGRSASWARK